MLTLPLATPRLRLRDFHADDADAYCRLRSGGAFGLHALGFLTGPVIVHAQGPWTRLTTQAGFVLTR